MELASEGWSVHRSCRSEGCFSTRIGNRRIELQGNETGPQRDRVSHVMAIFSYKGTRALVDRGAILKHK